MIFPRRFAAARQDPQVLWAGTTSRPFGLKSFVPLLLSSHVQLSDGELTEDHGVVSTTGAPDPEFATALRSAIAAHRDFHRAGLQAAP